MMRLESAPSRLCQVAAVCILLALAGCATSAHVERSLAAARLSVEEASQTEAPIVARSMYQQAQRKLTEAESALNNGDEVQSQRLAEEASVDARLSIAQADYENARRARIDLQEAMGRGSPGN